MATLLLIVIVLQATSQITTAMTAVEARRHIHPSLASTEYRNESDTSLSDKGGFSCPQDCTFSHLTNPPHVQVVCLIETFEYFSNFKVHKYNYNFSVFNDTDYPSQLLLFCDKMLTSVLDDAFFAGLHAFNNLKTNCRIKHVSSQAFKGLTSLKPLIIEGGENTEFDSECLQVPDLSNLEEVSITHTNTKAAPSMCNLDKLRLVNISHNEIEEFANTGLVCDKPTNIGIIDISDNKLHDLVKDFGEITNDLRILSVSRNMISYISPTLFTKMTQLEQVKMDNHRIFLIPQGIFCNNDKITTLFLSHNNALDMPKGLFSKVENLEFLRLENMTLNNNIWTSIANLTELKALYISDNTNIAHFTKTSLQNLKKLQIFDVSGGSLRCIPNGTFDNQNQMRLFNVSENNIQTIESGSFKGLSNLTTLSLKHNEIIHIHRDALLPLVSLLTLNISYNNLPEVPKFPVSLRMLDLRHNDITFLDQNSFTGLIDLKEINMQFNKLKCLPRSVFITNKNLQFLELSHNSITKIEYQSFSLNSPLEVLILNNNKICYVGYSFAPEYFSNLKTLDLSHNIIRRIGNPMFKRVFPPSIEELFLSWNYIFELDNGFIVQPSNLRIVDMRNNNISTIEQPMGYFVTEFGPVTFYLSNNPFFCDCNLRWLKKNEQYIYGGIFQTKVVISDYSKLYCQHVYRHQSDLLENIQDDKFLCKYSFRCFGFNVSSCIRCPINCTCYRSTDFDDDVIDCSNANLTSIPGNLSLISKTFDFSGNHFLTLEKFGNFTRLTELQLQHCDITVVHEGAFDCLINLTILDLGHNLLTSINSLMLRGLTKLRTLKLQYNKISFASEKTFNKLPALSYLDLSNNNLNVISGYEFKTFSSVVQLKLASNPWSCDCKYLERMKNFTIMHAHNILAFKDLSCTRQNSTAHMLGKYPFADVNLPDFCDNETVVYNHTHTEIDRLSKSAIAAMGIVLSITFLGLIAFGIIFWQREFLKVWCFVKFGWKFTGNDKKMTVIDHMVPLFHTAAMMKVSLSENLLRI